MPQHSSVFLRFTLAVLTSFSAPYALANEASLSAAMTFGGDLFHDPARVRTYASEIYVLDSKNHRIAVCSADGDFLYGLGEDEGLTQPLDMSIHANGDIFIADSGNQRIVRLRAGSPTLHWDLDYAPRSLVLHGDQLFVRANPGASHLFDVYELDGTWRASFGSLITDHSEPHFRNALNRVRLDSDGDRLFVAFQTVARVGKWNSSTDGWTYLDVRGQSVHESRDWFHESGHDAVRSSGLVRPEPGPSFEKLVDDVVMVSSDGTPHGNYILNGVGGQDDETWVLSNGSLLVYDTDGSLNQALHLRDADGGRTNIHGMTVEDEMVWVWDSFHENLVHGYLRSSIGLGLKKPLSSDDKEETLR